MKKIFFCLCLIMAGLACNGQTSNQSTIADGFYSMDTLPPATLPAGCRLVALSGVAQNSVMINTGDYVPLELKEATVVKKAGNGNYITLSLSPCAAQKMQHFTASHLGQQAAIVVNGKVITQNRIRTVIAGGKMEITGCEDKACNQLLAELQQDIKK